VNDDSVVVARFTRNGKIIFSRNLATGFYAYYLGLTPRWSEFENRFFLTNGSLHNYRQFFVHEKPCVCHVSHFVQKSRDLRTAFRCITKLELMVANSGRRGFETSNNGGENFLFGRVLWLFPIQKTWSSGRKTRTKYLSPLQC